MKRLFTFMMMAVVLFTACTKDDGLVVESNEVEYSKVKSVTIRASIAGETGTRVALGEEDEKKVNWTSGDQITLSINGESYVFTFVDDSENEFKYTAENGGKSLPALAANMVITAAYVGENISVNQSGTKEEVTQFMSLSATTTVTNEQRYSDLNLTFTHNTSVVKLALSHEDFKANDVTKIELNVGGNVKIVTTSTFEKDSENGTITAYVAVAPEALSNITLYAESENNGLYYADLSDITLVAGKLYKVTKTMEAVPFVTFTTNAAQTLKINNTVNNLEYSADNGSWTTLSANTEVSFNGNIRLRAMNNSQGTSYSTISFGNNEVKVAGSGDIRTLIDYKNHKTVATGDAQFAGLFYECTVLTSAPELPATTLSTACYGQMFYGCTSLTSAPELPATTLSASCYNQMFYGCTSLTLAPKLPAETLSSSCYTNMFYGCTSLETAPELKATTLAKNCCYQMFYGCTSLKTVPQLLATTMAEKCYYKMFYGCTSLETGPSFTINEVAVSCCFQMFESCSNLRTVPVTLSATTLAEECYSAMFANTDLQEAPALPATTLANGCYAWMFGNCTSLQTAPDLNATTLGNYCYQNMFNGCTSLQKAPKLPAKELTSACYQNMFEDCSILNEVTMLATTSVNTSNLSNWLSGVATTGTFNKAPGEVEGLETNSESGIPTGWNAVEYKATIITDPAQAVKGCLAMADGTFIPKDDIEKMTDEQMANVRGIVFWTTANSNASGNTPAKLTDDKIMANDFPYYNHGLIVSLTDVAQKVNWQKNSKRTIEFQNATSPYNGTDYVAVASSTGATDPINYILGYQNTKIEKAYNDTYSDNNNVQVLPVSLLETWKLTNSAPANTTGWYIPSVKELTLLCGKDVDNIYGISVGTDTRDAMNAILSSLGDTYADTLITDNSYWSSSERIDFTYGAFYVIFSSGLVVGNAKDYNMYVRAVCAF